jgi:squalene-associated FAD-dependent desaturase
MSETSRTTPQRRPGGTICVVGGGVAGIAAAIRLAEHGVPVTLVETRKRLGGRATSFNDPATGELVDNCQHVVMRCCTNVLDLYARLGVSDRIEWHRTLYFADDRGHIDAFVADDLPAPLHLTRAMWRMTTLSLSEKFAIARGMLAILQLGDARAAYLADMSFADWLAEQNQPKRVIDRFWSAVVISACNEKPEAVAARYAIQVFQEGFLAHGRAYEVGVSGVPLAALYDAAEPAIERAGGRVLLSTSAEKFEFNGHEVIALQLSSGDKVRADAFVSAVPFDRLARLTTELMVASDERLQRLDEITVSPIIGVHLYLRRDDGRPAMALPNLALLDSPLQWVFNKGVVGAGEHVGATYLHGVISAAHDLVDLPAEVITQRVLAEVRKVVPEAVEATLVHGRAIKEKRATFSVRPGVDRLRPRGVGAIGNLLLAGDWTDTGWPATMEGAARSGYAAAAAALTQLGVAHPPLVVPDLQATPVYRFLAG